MEKDKAHNIEEILTFLRGGDQIDVEKSGKEPEALSIEEDERII